MWRSGSTQLHDGGRGRVLWEDRGWGGVCTEEGCGLGVVGGRAEVGGGGGFRARDQEGFEEGARVQGEDLEGSLADMHLGPNAAGGWVGAAQRASC